MYLFDKVLPSLSMQEGPGPEGQRGARVVWVCGGKYLLVSGFDRYSILQKLGKMIIVLVLAVTL